MLLKISMSTEDIRTINLLRETSRKCLEDIEKNGRELENEAEKALELLNRIFYGCINQKLMEDEQKHC